MKVSLKIDGLGAIVAKLSDNPPIYAGPWKRALTSSLMMIQNTTKGRAPVATGKMKASITHRMQATEMPLWGVVTTDAENKGFRYPWALEAGKGKPANKATEGEVVRIKRGPDRGRMRTTAGTRATLHYRGTNKPTRRWFKGSVTVVRAAILNRLNAAAKQIEAAWGR